MGKITQAEEYLLEQIRSGDEGAWSRFVERYRGRLLNFAQVKLGQRADAEDIVQDTFVGFLTGVSRCRGDCSLETFLFTILRRKIINCYRSGYAKHICLIQDIYKKDAEQDSSDAFEDWPRSCIWPMPPIAASTSRSKGSISRSPTAR